MDEGLSRAVREVFVTLYREGLIYRDRRLVNWDPKLQTAISDLEVESREIRGSLWHLRYPIEGEADRFIVVATTRPETMLGDVAVAVHPEDARYRDLVGRHAILPLVGRRIPIIADPYSDPEKGTGAVKITPAHDFNDFAVGQRHGLAMPSVLDREGRVTLAEIEGDDPFLRSLDGQDRFAARKAIVAELEARGLLERIEPHTHQVPHGDRSGVPIEPLLTTQWYCNAGELAKAAIEAVETGRTRFVPAQWENTFFAWMRDIQPWCISRQLWWGHRIPAWFGPDGQVFVAHDEDEAKASARAHYGRDEALTQDEDVLDTWFSSALWPFSTLGWPDRTPELARYYPGDVLVTGFDIIFFWVARMMMMGLHFMGEVPFRDVYIHGLVRDERGQKMSKSKGNVIDPLELMDEFGTDALRFTVCALTGPGRDIKLGRSTVESYRSFVTKIWNAARFCEMNGVAPAAGFDPATASSPLCRWMLDALNTAIADATAALEAYRFNDYAAACYRTTWNDFCDWFLEFAKPVLNGPDGPAKDEVRATASHVLGVLLRLLHPAMPFVTEYLWDELGYGPTCSLIRAPWPTPFRHRARAGAGGARLGGPPGRRGAGGAGGDERRPVRAGPGAAPRRAAGNARPRAGLVGSDPAHGPRLRGRPARWRLAARQRAGGAGRGDGGDPAGRADRPGGRAGPAAKGPRPRAGRGREGRAQARQRRLRPPRAAGGGRRQPRAPRQASSRKRRGSTPRSPASRRFRRDITD